MLYKTTVSLHRASRNFSSFHVNPLFFSNLVPLITPLAACGNEGAHSKRPSPHFPSLSHRTSRFRLTCIWYFCWCIIIGGGGNRCRIYKSNGPHIEIAILHVRPFFCVCREGQPIVRHGGICIPFLLVGKKKNGVEEGGKKFFLLLPYRPFWQFCLNRPQSMQSKQTVLCPGISQFSLFLNNYVR